MPENNNNKKRTLLNRADSTEQIMGKGLVQYSPSPMVKPNKPLGYGFPAIADIRMHEKRQAEEGPSGDNNPAENRVARMGGKKKKQIFGRGLNPGMGNYHGSALPS